MITATQCTQLPYPAELVWDVVTSLADTSWRSDINSCRATGPDTFEEVAGGSATAFTITHKTPCTHYAFTLQNSALTGRWEGRFASDGSGTALTFTESVSVKNPLQRLLAPAYLRRQQRRYLRDLTSYLRRLSRHVVLIDSQSETAASLLPLLRRTVAVALEAEAVEEPCEISILLTDDKGIRQTNREMRGVDKPTDVLSFPMFDLTPPAGPQKADLDPATALVPLGDMCISLQRAKAQAKEYGHSLERETAYLAVHSVLHLLGYDHVDEGAKKRQMRRREEEIMKKLDLTR